MILLNCTQSDKPSCRNPCDVRNLLRDFLPLFVDVVRTIHHTCKKKKPYFGWNTQYIYLHICNVSAFNFLPPLSHLFRWTVSVWRTTRTAYCQVIMGQHRSCRVSNVILFMFKKWLKGIWPGAAAHGGGGIFVVFVLHFLPSSFWRVIVVS